MQTHHHENALILFARAPEPLTEVQDDHPAILPWEDLDLLFTAFLGDLMRTAAQLDETDVHLYRKSDELSDDFFLPFRHKVHPHDLADASRAEQIQTAIERAFKDGYHRVVVVLENHPLIGLSMLKRVFDQLKYEDDCLVLEPSVKGDCLLLGMKTNHSALFDQVGENPADDGDLLMQRICDAEAMVFLTPSRSRLDSPAKLSQLRDLVRAVDRRSPEFPIKTVDAFKILDKKYYRVRRVFR